MDVVLREHGLDRAQMRVGFDRIGVAGHDRPDGGCQRKALSPLKVMIRYNISLLVKGPVVLLSDFHLAAG